MAAKNKHKRRNFNRGFEKLRISVNGCKALFEIGDHVKLHEGDVRRCVTKIMVDSDGCISYCMSFLADGCMTQQWVTQNDLTIMGSLDEEPNKMGFA